MFFKICRNKRNCSHLRLFFAFYFTFNLPFMFLSSKPSMLLNERYLIRIVSALLQKKHTTKEFICTQNVMKCPFFVVNDLKKNNFFPVVIKQNISNKNVY
nr:hypothetical protein pLIS51_00471 [Listeria seeligeri]